MEGVESTNDEATTIFDLPFEDIVMTHIVKHLDIQDLINLMRCSRAFKSLAERIFEEKTAIRIDGNENKARLHFFMVSRNCQRLRRVHLKSFYFRRDDESKFNILILNTLLTNNPFITEFVLDWKRLILPKPTFMQCKNLTHLKLIGVKCRDTFFNALAKSNILLQRVSFKFIFGFSSKAFVEFLTNQPNLRTIDLMNLKIRIQPTLHAIAKGCRKLEEMGIWGIRDVESEDLLHSLSQQRSLETKEEPSVASTAPTPRHSPLMRSPAEMCPGRRGGGSDSNLSRATISNGTDMRKSTLLRRFWGRDARRGVDVDSRSGSWSPPPRRSQRRLHFDAHQCVECQKLNGTHNSSGSSTSSSQSSVFLASGRTPLLASPKRLKLMATPSAATESVRRGMESEITETSSPLARDSPTTTGVSSSSPQVSNGRKNVLIYMTSLETPTSQENNNPSEESLRIEIETTTLTSATGDENMNEPPTTTTVTRTERVNRHHSEEEMDRYISKLLIDSLNNVIETTTGNELITSEDTNGNEAAATRESTADENLNTVDGEVVYSAISTADISDPALDVSDSGTVSTTPHRAQDIGVSVEPPTASEEEKVPIYFPRYSAESKGDLSSYTSACSEPEPQEIAAVGTGSSYPDIEVNGEPILVPRLSAFPRTESMEVQPSSASACEDVENGDVLPDDEDSVSLVDSLDDPDSPDHKYHSTESLRPLSSGDTARGDKSPYYREKGEAFFVPMSDNKFSVDEHLVVADTMPEKLRDKLVKRQKRRDMKKEQELRRRQKMQKYIDQRLEERLEELQVNGNRNTRAIIAKKDIPIVSTASASTVAVKGTKKNVLRTEIGMLESYTIDSRGNMQFNPPAKEPPTKVTKAPTAKRTSITRKITKSKSEEHPPPEKKFQVKKSASDTLPRRGKGTRKDVQHMTLYQTADLTPDTEGGPRRMYQKTEIQDGEKRIEILEIVECLDTSPETSPGARNPLTYRVGGKSGRRSRIPVPVYKSARKTSGSASPRTMANAKVDKLIADLLIEALNNPVGMGIEFVQSPKIEKAVNGKRNGVKKRSANSGIKYHQVFDVIPEERSSFSLDSSNEESGTTHKSRGDSGHGASARSTTKETTQSSGVITKPTSVEDNTKNVDKSSPETSEKNQTNRGRAALESDTWLGFFKPHEESSAEEESSRTHHHYCPHHPCHLMLTPSSDTLTTVSSSITHNPTISLSSTVDFYTPDPSVPDTTTFHTSSSGSDNILTVIEKENSSTSSLPQPHDSVSDALATAPQPKPEVSKTPREASEPIDSDSFVIIPAVEATPVSATKELPEPESAKSTQSSVKTRDVCKDCCFCNPDLHKKTSPDDTSRSCHFCDKKRQTSADKKPEEDTFSGYETAKSHHYYEVMSKSDHQHTKTKCKDPETISTRCVKTNERIQRFVPSPEDAKSTKAKITRPKDVPKPISRGSAVHRVIRDEVEAPRKPKNHQKTQQKIQFPSPYRILSSPQSYDDASSCSEDADSSPPAPRMNPTMRSRWANSSRFASHRKTTNSRMNASSHAKSTSSSATPGTNAGWSVTVAGNYHPQLAPDVEMRLSFPKTLTETTLPQPPPSTATTNRDLYEMTPPPAGASESRPRPALPPTSSSTLNPKRSLTKVTPAPSANGRNYRFPEVNTATSQAVSRQTAKKAIKRVECSVAVTSATRTISKFSRAQRAMSFQSLHPAIEDSYRNRSRDGSIGNLSSRRLSLDGSQSDDMTSLTIMGNAIAPEIKPRVPTMSEKDLTRRHSSCFTRNRSYLT